MKIDRFVNDILSVVSVESVTENFRGIAECQKVVGEIAKNFGFDVSLHGNGRVLVIQPKGLCGVPKLGLVTHLDTVPFEKEKWLHNPLGEVVDGRIYGRGVLDDKCAIIQSLYAVKDLESEILPSWQLIVGSSEEGEWIDMKEYMDENPVLPECMVTIDGDGVQNGCRGYLDLELTFTRKTIITNLTELYIPNGVNNTVPDKAIANVRGKYVEADGIAVHSSIPEMGKNALTILAEELAKDSSVRMEFPTFFELMQNLAKSDADEYLGFENGTSVSATKCLLNQDSLVINLNVRLSEHTKKDGFFDVLKSLQERYSCKIEVQELIFPAYVPADSEEIRLMCSAYEQVMGKKIYPTVAKGVGYNAALPNCSIFGPRFSPEDDEPDTCHAVDENRSIEDLIKFQSMLEIFVKEVLK